MATTYYDNGGNLVPLGAKIGEGGEGTVYSIAGKIDYVAKVYKHAIDREKADKIRLMASMKADAIAQFAAWPTTPLFRSVNGPVQGVVIPRISQASEIHEVYNPSHRKQSFPNFDYRHLARVARNCAIAFSKLHQMNVVVGDVNQGNIFVDSKATVMLIDCDSFQLSTSQRTYKCLVGVPHFTPPELQSTKLSECIRTHNHDNFGLAVMIFQLLFMGRHPFVGYTGKGDMPIEKAIAELRFAFGKDAHRFEMKAPPNALTSTKVPGFVFDLFERAFARSGCNAASRPTASEWANALGKMEPAIRRCTDDEAHYYWNLNATCPWCDIQNQGGPNFFLAIATKKSADNRPSFSLDEISRQISAVQAPEVAFQSAKSVATYPIVPPIVHVRVPSSTDDLRRIFAIVGIAMAVFGFVAAFFTIFAFVPLLISAICGIVWFEMWLKTPYAKERKKRVSYVVRANKELSRVQNEMNRIARLQNKLFHEKQAQFLTLRTQLQSLTGQRATELAMLQRTARDRQLEVYLRACFINEASIRGVGASRIASLESYGVDSAWYVTWSTVGAVPGFGPELTSRVLSWRAGLEASFRYDPSKGVPPIAIQTVEHKYDRLCRQLENAIRQIPEELRQMNKTYTPQVVAQAKLYDQTSAIRDHAIAELKQLPRFTL